MVRPKLAVVTEFGEELQGIRKTVIDEIKAFMNNDHPESKHNKELPIVLPGNHGLKIALPDLKLILRQGRIVDPKDVD